jgi:hypothetical protein
MSSEVEAAAHRELQLKLQRNISTPSTSHTATMPADRLLGTLIRSLQTYTDQQDTPRLLATAASLLISLQNPLNITLLTTQLLTAPALWHRPEGLQTCLRLVGVFSSAALALLRREEEEAADTRWQWYPTPSQGLPKEAWAKAVLKGASDKSQAWKHPIVIAGLMLGFGSPDEEHISRSLRSALEQALVKSVNAGLQEIRGGDEFGAQCITFCINHTFPLLSDFERSMIDYDLLLPALVGSAFFSNEGLQGAYFLGGVDLDITKGSDGKLSWKTMAPSFHHIEGLLARPLVMSLGPVSRLISHSVENIRDSTLIPTMIDDLHGFTKALLTQWRQTRLSVADSQEESLAFSEETIQKTTPQLWKLLKASLFALTIVFRGAVGRLLSDRYLASDAMAPNLVCNVLNSLRNIYFIASRIGTNSFTHYTFVYLTCIDILSQFPPRAESFLHSIQPVTLDSIPSSPVERALALYFLNTAEHFTLVLSPATNENLLVAASLPYLATGNAKQLLPLFEAAHSVMLAVLSAPQSAETAARHTPFYVDALFSTFPDSLTPRQFRLAFKTLMRVAAPPSSLSATHPELPAILLELINHRALNAPTVPLPEAINSPLSPDGDGATSLPPLSEQAVLALTLVDALPYLPLDLLEDWLPVVARLVNVIADGPMKDVCRRRFWEVLVNGEMDPERALLSVTWWSTHGGRELVMGLATNGGGQQQQQQQYLMSGAAGGMPGEQPKL